MAKINLNDYAEIDRFRGFLIYKRIDEGKRPVYVCKHRKYNSGAMSDHLTDIKILAKELDSEAFGLGHISGYRYGGVPPEEVYRGVKIGKYLYRDHAIDLPRFFANCVPPNNKLGRLFDKLKTGLTGSSVPEVREKIDTLISKLPDKVQAYFPR